MPANTRVDRCFQKVRGERGDSSAAAICQSSTGQSLQSGKPLRKRLEPRVQHVKCGHLRKGKCHCHECGG